MKKALFLSLLTVLLFACKSDKESKQEPVIKEIKPVTVPAVNRDSLYHYVERQVAFGPRNPLSTGHEECKNWIVEKLISYNMQVEEQTFEASIYTGVDYNATNIIGSYKPNQKQRIVLAAHWDTRFHADKDDEDRDTPILGADDGGSGVAVLLEVARQLSLNPVDIGVDFIFFDAEDQGNSDAGDQSLTWCLGSNHWAKEAKEKGYKADYGILVDMVGAKGATFTKEEASREFASEILDKVWYLAGKMGFSSYFVNQNSYPVQDDHIPINVIAKIPTIDIINYKNGFGKHWHTHDDNLDIIDKHTLQAVAQVVTASVYKTYSGEF